MIDGRHQTFSQKTACILYSVMKQEVKNHLLEYKCWCTLCVIPPPRARSCLPVDPTLSPLTVVLHCVISEKKYFLNTIS